MIPPDKIHGQPASLSGAVGDVVLVQTQIPGPNPRASDQDLWLGGRQCMFLTNIPSDCKTVNLGTVYTASQPEQN